MSGRIGGSKKSTRRNDDDDLDHVRERGAVGSRVVPERKGARNDVERGGDGHRNGDDNSDGRVDGV